MAWTFARHDILGEGWTLRALKSGLVVGRILHGAPDRKYRFYNGGGGPGTPVAQQAVLENYDLEKLKEAIQNLV